MCLGFRQTAPVSTSIEPKDLTPEGQTWCPLPWISQSIRNNGELRVCCHANQSKDRGIIRHSDGSAVFAGTDKLKDARNSDLLKDVRASMLKGQWHSACNRCFTEEQAGIRSRRIYESEAWRNAVTAETSMPKTHPDGEIDVNNFPLKFMDIRFGNLCNLKCRSCGPTDSSKWYSDYYKLWGGKFSESSQTMVLSENNGNVTVSPNPYIWHESESFWDQMESNIANIDQLYLVGGEPLLINAHYKFLQRCVDEGHASRIKIEYNSNISSIPSKAWELWKHFKVVQVGASIDGIGKVNDYIRHPSKWENIERNLEALDKAEGNFRILVSATIMIYNILNVPDMMIWKANKNFSRVNGDSWKPLITPHPLHRPYHLNIQALPEFAKKTVEQNFKKRKPDIFDAIANTPNIKNKERAYSSVDQTLDKYVSFMWQKDLSHEMPRFWEFTTKLDNLRGESLAKSVPELYELLESTRPKDG